MQVDIIRAQHQRLREALAALTSLTAPAPERTARAVAEIERAFADGVPVWAQHNLETIRALVGEARGAEARSARLTGAQLTELAAACLDLYTVACREYWTA
jgi:hypothetical protein